MLAFDILNVIRNAAARGDAPCDAVDAARWGRWYPQRERVTVSTKRGNSDGQFVAGLAESVRFRFAGGE